MPAAYSKRIVSRVLGMGIKMFRPMGIKEKPTEEQVAKRRKMKNAGSSCTSRENNRGDNVVDSDDESHCVCQKPGDGKMVLCEDCKTW